MYSLQLFFMYIILQISLRSTFQEDIF